MNKETDVVALGELLVDMAEGQPSKQENMTFEACPGGAPCNVLALLSKAGMKTAFIGKVGDDFLGHMLGDTIEKIGISTRDLKYDEKVNTTLAFVHKKPDGDRDFSFYRNPGADMMLTEEEVDEELIASARVFHFGTLSMTAEGVKAATKKAVETAKEHDCLISFDPNLREPLWDSLDNARQQMLWGLAHCDILKISDNEVEFLTGQSDMTKGFEEIKKLTSARLVFVTLGKDGSMGWGGGKVVTASGVKMESVVDTTGAGDTFMGCALYYVLRNGIELSDEQVKELLTFANEKAALITQVKGALKVMPQV